MKTERGSALWLTLAVVVVVALVEGVLILRMESRMTSLESRIALEGGGGETTPLALAEEMRALEQQVRDNTETVRLVHKRLQAGSERLAEVARRAEAAEAAGALAPGSGAAESAALRGEALDKAVAKAVDEKLGSLPRNKDGEWKPSLDEFQKTLALSDEQADSAERIFDDAKHEMFQVASLKREDGTCWIDDLAGAFKDPDPEAKMKEVFMTLFTNKIPGRDETYIVEVLRIRERAQKSLTSVLDEKQSKRMLRMNLDYLGVKTSYDPFAEYIQESVR